MGKYNGNELRVAKLKGDLHLAQPRRQRRIRSSWPDGCLNIEFRDGVRRLKAGEMLVVPRGAEHRPFAEEEALVFMTPIARASPIRALRRPS